MKKILSNAISLFVIVIVLLLVIPLNPFILDIFFIMNISVSLIILLITMNIKEPLEFSIFPSLLLITTLFRIGLNISSTRLILTKQGQAGQGIQAIGTFVLQGNVVVGVIIFLIIVLVQFIVITKGAERVAEVAARFTLDAMPGKQMAIDADLSSGLINEEQARTRRHKIQKEADFYGAMDGATKTLSCLLSSPQSTLWLVRLLALCRAAWNLRRYCRCIPSLPSVMGWFPRYPRC